jgi:MFS family permease
MVMMLITTPSPGYDGSLMASINVIPEYQDYYNLGSSGATSTGVVFSIYQIGQMTGALFTWMADWRGRRFTICLGCAGVVFSAIFIANAPTIGAFIAARFLVSFFATIAMTSAPLLLVEIAPPTLRGTIAGGYNTLYYLGSIIASFGESSTGKLKGEEEAALCRQNQSLTNILGSNLRRQPPSSRKPQVASCAVASDDLPWNRRDMWLADS